MNPQRTWRLLNFYSAGAVRTAVELTQNYLLKSVAPVVQLYGERGSTVWYIFINWDHMPSVAYRVPGPPARADAPPFDAPFGGVKGHASAVKSRGVAARGAPPAAQPWQRPAQRVPERRGGRGRQ